MPRPASERPDPPATDLSSAITEAYQKYGGCYTSYYTAWKHRESHRTLCLDAHCCHRAAQLCAILSDISDRDAGTWGDLAIRWEEIATAHDHYARRGTPDPDLAERWIAHLQNRKVHVSPTYPQPSKSVTDVTLEALGPRPGKSLTDDDL